ncbi:hypothetical protein LguiA_019202 [Lonicera macranthoides]
MKETFTPLARFDIIKGETYMVIMSMVCLRGWLVKKNIYCFRRILSHGFFSGLLVLGAGRLG